MQSTFMPSKPSESSNANSLTKEMADSEIHREVLDPCSSIGLLHGERSSHEDAIRE